MVDMGADMASGQCFVVVHDLVDSQLGRRTGDASWLMIYLIKLVSAMLHVQCTLY